MEFPAEIQSLIHDFIRPKFVTRSDWKKGSYIHRCHEMSRREFSRYYSGSRSYYNSLAYEFVIERCQRNIHFVFDSTGNIMPHPLNFRSLGRFPS